MSVDTVPSSVPLSADTGASGVQGPVAGGPAAKGPAAAKDVPARVVSASDFGGPELAMSLALADVAIEKLQEKVQTLKVRQGMNKEVERKRDQKVIEQMEAAAKAAKGGLLVKIFGWIGKILMLAVAAVSVVATGGATSGLMAAAVVLAAYDIAASAAMEAKPGLHIGLADGLGKLVGLMAKAAGASEEEIKQSEQWGGMALALVVQLGVCAAALAPNAAAKAMSKVADLLSNMGKFFIGLGTRTGKVMGESFNVLAKSPMLADFVRRIGSAAAERAPLLEETALAAASTTAKSAGAGAAATSTTARAGAAASDAAGTAGTAGSIAEHSWEDTSKWVKVALKLQGPVGMLQGANAVTSGALGIKSGVDQYRAALVEAEALEETALLNYLHAFFEKEKQEMEIAAKEVGTVVKKVGEMIDLRADTESTIASNFGPVVAA